MHTKRGTYVFFVLILSILLPTARAYRICEAGKEWLINGCMQCVQGNYKDNDMQRCAKCAEGKFSGYGASVCIDCLAGTSSGDGATVCTNCSAGTSSNDRAATCTDCTAGKYSPEGSPECFLCAAGTSSDDRAAECTNCPEGKYSDTGQGNCTTCEDGKYQHQSGKSSCHSCPENTSSNYQRTTCLCNEGYYPTDSLGGSGTCSACAAGKYQRDINGECHNCQRGTYSNLTAQWDVSSCNLCPTGKTSPESNAYISGCVDCDAGKYSVMTINELYHKRNQECEPCDIGKYSHSGLSSCLLCAAGKYNGEFGMAQCQDCELGKYGLAVQADSNIVCQDCPEGKYSDVSGLNTSQGCKPCTATPGFFCKKASTNASGHICPAGYICAGQDQDKNACEPGTYSLSRSSACLLCHSGKYSSSDDGAAECTNCPVDKTSTFGSSKFTHCFYLDHGLGICPPGFYRTANDNCEACSFLGSYEDYERHWKREVRYTLFKSVEDMKGDYPNGNLSTYWQILREEEELQRSRFDTARDTIARYCGLYQDVVICPSGLVYDMSTRGCKLFETKQRCSRGSYLNETENRCRQCPRNLTTLYSGAVSETSCLFCNSSFYLKRVGNQEACYLCNETSHCSTTQGFGGAMAHRMQHCSIQCSPEHMHPDNESQYNCYFSQCMVNVRAQDIHSCVFDENGDIRTNASNSPCHAYFSPLHPEWVKAANNTLFSWPPSQRQVYPYEYGSDNQDQHAIRQMYARVQHAYKRGDFLNFFYFLFATNTIRGRDSDGNNIEWPHLSDNEIDQSSDSEAFMVEEGLANIGMLLIKDVQVLSSEETYIQGVESHMKNMSIFGDVLKWTDMGREMFQVYQRRYLDEKVNRSCSHLLRRDTTSMYRCHSKEYVDAEPAYLWKPGIDVSSSCVSNMVLLADCDKDNFKTLLTNRLLNKTIEAMNECLTASSQDCLLASQVKIDLPGIDNIQVDKKLYPFTDDDDFSTLEILKTEYQDLCHTHGNSIWFCNDLNKCLSFDPVANNYVRILSRKNFPSEHDFVFQNEPDAMRGQTLFQEMRNAFCRDGMKDENDILTDTTPEFSQSYFMQKHEEFYSNVRSFQGNVTYECSFSTHTVTSETCLFIEEDDNFKLKFVDALINDAATVNVTIVKKEASRITVKDIIVEVDHDVTNPFCTISTPLEFEMIRGYAITQNVIS